jgi:hypothetical protein
MPNRYMIVDNPNLPRVFWKALAQSWTTERKEAQIFSQEERDRVSLPTDGCWLLIDEVAQAKVEFGTALSEAQQFEERMRPRLLKEIGIETESLIYETLRELRTLFPSYRDDQLFTFWLGRLATKGVDIHDFDSTVTFQS